MITEELGNKIVETFEKYEQASYVSAIIATLVVLAFITSLVLDVIYMYKRNKQIKEWRSEYKATLTDEQLKAIEQYNKIK